MNFDKIFEIFEALAISAYAALIGLLCLGLLVLFVAVFSNPVMIETIEEVPCFDEDHNKMIGIRCVDERSEYPPEYWQTAKLLWKIFIPIIFVSMLVYLMRKKEKPKPKYGDYLRRPYDN